MAVLWIDLTTGTSRVEALPTVWRRDYIGGRGINVRRLFDAVPRHADPLGPENALIIGTGPLDGTSFPGAARVNFTAKSPQTGILGDSNAGGFFGPELRYAGFDQVIIQGKSEKPVYIFICDGKARILPAAHLWGKDVWDTQAAVLEELGDPRVQVAAVGPAAEHGVTFAGIFCNLTRAAARTGMGTVLASKNVKAVAVRGHQPVVPANPERFERLVEEVDAKIRAHAEYQVRCHMGTTKLITALDKLGCLATRHFQTGRFEGASSVSGEQLAAVYKVKQKACFSCTIPCSRFWAIPSGPYAGTRSEGPEFEGLAAFSSRIGNSDLEFALSANDICNRLGMDVITASEVISWSMELYQRGMLSRAQADGIDLSWGNRESTLLLLKKIASRDGFGDVLADGVRAAAEKLGVGRELAMHVKGLEVFQADPRGIKAYALGYAVASRGGDHLRSEPWFEFSEDAELALRRYGVREAAFRLEHRGKGLVVKDAEERSALADCLDACKNTITNMEILSYDECADMLTALLGEEFTGAGVHEACERLVNLERVYNATLGMRRADDTLPKRFLLEPLPEGSGPSTGQVVDLAPMLDEYYRARGWDADTGLPLIETLERLGLSAEASQIYSTGRNERR